MNQPLAIITGGEGDLAKYIATHLRQLHYRVETPGRSTLDVSRAGSVDSYFEKHETISLLINNAGVTSDSLFLRQSRTDRDRLLDVNLKGAHLCSQAASRAMMRNREGHIINLGSYSALNPPLGQTSYAAAKAGLIGLTKSYAKELGKRNIRVNCVLPGFLETKMTRDLSESAKAAALSKHTLRRFNTCEEAARFIAFLETSPHISGQVFQLDSRA